MKWAATGSTSNMLDVVRTVDDSHYATSLVPMWKGHVNLHLILHIVGPSADGEWLESGPQVHDWYSEHVFNVSHAQMHFLRPY